MSMYWNKRKLITGDHFVFTRYTVDGQRLEHLQGFYVKGRDFDDFNREVEAEGFTLKDSGTYTEDTGSLTLIYSRWTMVKQGEEEE